MILRAAREHDIDLARSWVIGDGVVDIEAGAAAGVPAVLVLTGYGRGLVEHQKERLTTPPAHTAEDVLEAVRWILAREGGTG
jgi:D-glycero-D-manno-heptose 1,7-bisphosphate phosphatase